MNDRLIEVVDLCIRCCCLKEIYVVFEYNSRIDRFEVRIFEQEPPSTSMLLHSGGGLWYVCGANDEKKLIKISEKLKSFLDLQFSECRKEGRQSDDVLRNKILIEKTVRET